MYEKLLFILISIALEGSLTQLLNILVFLSLEEKNGDSTGFFSWRKFVHDLKIRLLFSNIELWFRTLTSVFEHRILTVA